MPIKDIKVGYLQLSLFWDTLLFLGPFSGVEEHAGSAEEDLQWRLTCKRKNHKCEEVALSSPSCTSSSASTAGAQQSRGSSGFGDVKVFLPRKPYRCLSTTYTKYGMRPVCPLHRARALTWSC